MEKEENLNQEDTSIEPSEENNKPEDQTEKVEKSTKELICTVKKVKVYAVFTD